MGSEDAYVHDVSVCTGEQVTQTAAAWDGVWGLCERVETAGDPGERRRWRTAIYFQFNLLKHMSTKWLTRARP